MTDDTKATDQVDPPSSSPLAATPDFATIYEVDAIGPPPANKGAMDTRVVTLTGIAKFNGANAPAVVPNEYICGRLASALGLPTPPIGLLQTPNGHATVSLRFGMKGESPPPADVAKLCEDEPYWATGVIVFDCWVCNNDRHSRNIAYAPGKHIYVTIFDHSHTLGGPGRADVSKLVANPDMVVRNRLAPSLKTGKYLESWCERIEGLSRQQIDEVFLPLQANQLITKDDRKGLVKFLDHRRLNIRDLIKASEKDFKGIDFDADIGWKSL